MGCPCYRAPAHCTPEHDGVRRCPYCKLWDCRFNRRTRRDLSAPLRPNPIRKRIERAEKIAVLKAYWEERDNAKR